MAKKRMAVPKDFQVGDIVLVERSGKNVRRSDKWQNIWVTSMNNAVGKCFTVTDENFGNGVRLSFLEGGYQFPEKVLRLIKRGDKTYFRKGDKVLIARKSETIAWNSQKDCMDETLGKVYPVTMEHRQYDDYAPALYLSTETGNWAYGTDCIELYTGQVPDEQPQPVKEFIIDEPLQDYERF